MDAHDHQALGLIVERFVLDRLLNAAASDPVLRDAVRRTATWLLRELDQLNYPSNAAAAVEQPATIADGLTTEAATQPPDPAPVEPLQPAVSPVRKPVTLNLGAPLTLEVRDIASDAPPRDRVVGFAGPNVVEPRRSWQGEISPALDLDLQVVAERCRIKGDSCLFAIDRQALGARGEAIEQLLPRRRELITRAKAQPDCYLWAVDPNAAWMLPDGVTLRQAAGAYDALARAVSLAWQLVGASDPTAPLEEAFTLLAEAQSALRGVLETLEEPLVDQDQFNVFIWLRRQLEERRIFVRRHMKLDDTADAANSTDLCRRIDELRQGWESVRRRDRDREQLIKKARYHARRMRGTEWALEDVASLSGALDSLSQSGITADSNEIREILRPLLEDVTEIDLPPALRAALETVAAASRSAPVTDATEDRAARISPDVARVADLLRGKAMVLIGGESREYSRRAIQRSLELSELYWLDAPVHESLARFEPYVARPDVALVGVIIKLSSHSFGELRDVARRYGKAYINLTHGYNARQIARAVLEQCSRLLGEGRDAPEPQRTM